MGKMVRDLQRCRVALGSYEKVRLPNEVKPLTKMSKSVVAARALPAGTVLSESDLALKSPGGGLPPYELDGLLGKRLKVALEPDAQLKAEDVE